MTADESWDAIVVGAGLAGWSAAYELGRCQWRVLLLEADNRIGGKVRKRRWGDLVYEQGALRRSASNTLYHATKKAPQTAAS